MTKLSKYNKKYYQDNKERISKYKKNKYITDPIYRQKAILEAKIRLALKKLKIKEQNMINIGDRAEYIYTTDQVSTILGRDKQTLYLWKKTGLMPKPIKRNTYTHSQVYFMDGIFRKIDNGLKITYKELKECLDYIWDKPYSVETLEEVLNGNKDNKKG